MASDDMTDQRWEAARLATQGAFRPGTMRLPLGAEGVEAILKFVDYHFRLQAAGEDHGPSINFALDGVAVEMMHEGGDILVAEHIRNFNCTSPSFVNGLRSIIRPDNSCLTLRGNATFFIAFISDTWFNSPQAVMEPEEMSDFCEHLTMFLIDDVAHNPYIQTHGVTILFGILRSPQWRKHMVSRLWGMLAYCALAKKDLESFRWCLQNAIELLEFTRGLPDGEGLKWWCAALWFYYDKLDSEVQGEVEKVTVEMSSGDSHSNLNLYLNLIEKEVARTRRELDEISDEGGSFSYSMDLRASLVALEGNYHKLSQIIDSW